MGGDRVHRYSQPVPVKQDKTSGGMVIRTEAGVAIAGTAGATVQTVT